MSIGHTITGDRELDRELKRLDAKAAKRAIRKALRRSGAVIAGDTQARAGEVSQRLAAGIKVKAAKGLRRGQVGIGIHTPTRAELGIPADDKHFWPAAVEFGAKPHTIKAKDGGYLVLHGGVLARQVKHPGLKARPYMRPALYNNKEATSRIFQKELRAELGLNRP